MTIKQVINLMCLKSCGIYYSFILQSIKFSGMRLWNPWMRVSGRRPSLYMCQQILWCRMKFNNPNIQLCKQAQLLYTDPTRTITLYNHHSKRTQLLWTDPTGALTLQKRQEVENFVFYYQCSLDNLGQNERLYCRLYSGIKVSYMLILRKYVCGSLSSSNFCDNRMAIW